MRTIALAYVVTVACRSIPAPKPLALGVLVSVLLPAACTLDTSPTTPPRSDTGHSAAWSPSSRASEAKSSTADDEPDAQLSDSATAADGDAAESVKPRDAGTATKSANGMRDAGKAEPRKTSNLGTLDAATPSDGAARAMPCAPGMYSGTFDGSVTYIEGSLSTITGTVQAELALDSSGKNLSVRAGEITGVSDGTRMTSMWTGTLNCQTQQLEDATQAGAWENGSSFSGTLQGSYTAEDSALAGTWQVRSDLIPFAGGRGDFRMVRNGTSAP